MEDNPYQAITRMFRNPDPADGLQLFEGTIRSVTPVSVEACGMTISGADVRINAQLLGGWSQSVEIQQPNYTLAGEETVRRGLLRAGDQVLCLTQGGAVLYILAKVVNA